MLDAGFRCGDVVSLKFSNISFSGNYLTVKGKGSKFRTVLLCPKLKKLLSHYLIKFRAYDPKDDYSVFVKVGSNEPINSNVIKQLFARIKKTSEIDRVHPHLLRHTFATSYIVGGGSMEFLRLMMGQAVFPRFCNAAGHLREAQGEVRHARELRAQACAPHQRYPSDARYPRADAYPDG